MRTFSLYQVRILSLATLLFMAMGAHAATLSVQLPASVPIGVPFTIQVMLDSGGDVLNAIDGTVHIPSGISVQSVDTGSSLLALWPVEPVYRVSDDLISFAGGTPGGLAANTTGTVFTITAVADAPGTYRFSTANVSGYLNDGKGTRVAIAVASGSTNASATAPAPAGTPADSIAPVFTSVAIGSDASLFGGQYFASFYATDSGSGVDYYEVKEGWWSPYVRADRYYVLHDQSLQTDVTVRAVDGAGNAVTATIPAAHPWPHRILYLVLVALVVGVVYAVKRRKK
jgi:hypothetical protein